MDPDASVVRWFRLLWVAAALCLVSAIPPLVADEAVDRKRSVAPSQELKVGIAELAPFAFKGTNGAWEGISVGLWREIAAQRQWKYQLHEFGFQELLPAVPTGKVDVALTPYAFTPENMELVDFTHPYYSSGLCVAVARGRANALHAITNDIFSARFLGTILVMVGLLVAVGAAVWLVERRASGSQFGDEPRRGIGNGVWWAAVTLTTVGYGDKVPRTAAGRTLAMLWLFSGVFLLAAFTGHISSVLTLDRLQSPIQGPQDLPAHRVGVVEGSASADYVLEHHIRSRSYPTLDAALDGVRKGSVVAILAAEPFLRYRLRQDPSIQVEILPFSLDRRDYAFVVPEGSPLRAAMNRETMQVRSRAVWKELLFKYLEE